MVIIFLSPFFGPISQAGGTAHARCSMHASGHCNGKVCHMKKEATKAGHRCHLAGAKTHKCKKECACAIKSGAESPTDVQEGTWLKERLCITGRLIFASHLAGVNNLHAFIQPYEDHFPEGLFRPPALA